MNEFLESPGLHALEAIHELVQARNGGETEVQHSLHAVLREVRGELTPFVVPESE